MQEPSAPPRLGRGALRLPGGEGAQGAIAAPPHGGSEFRTRAAPLLRRMRRGTRGGGGAAARSGGRAQAGAPFTGASRALRGGGGRGDASEDAPEPLRP